MSDPVRVYAHPKLIANVLKNVVTMMSEPGTASKPGPVPYVQIVVEAPDGPVEGSLRASGVGRYMVGTDSAEVDGEDDGRLASIRVLGKNPEKTDVVDDLWKLAMAIQRTSTAKDARVHLVLEDGESIAAYFGDEFLGELGEQDPDGLLAGDEDHVGFYEQWEDLIRETAEAPETSRRLCYSIELISRLKDIRADTPVADFKVHPDKPAVAVAIGPTFRGLYVGIEREGYAAGGSWNNGPGTPECLLG